VLNSGPRSFFHFNDPNTTGSDNIPLNFKLAQKRVQISSTSDEVPNKKQKLDKESTTLLEFLSQDTMW